MGQALDLLIRDAIPATAKESKGTFLIRSSIDRVAQHVNISKFTVYNYLEEVKSRQEATQAMISWA